MKLKTNLWLWVSILWVLNASMTSAQVSVLFVGNSYTYFNDMPQMVKKISEENGTEISVILSVSGGSSLKDHWQGNSGLITKQLIAQGSFDYVILQDQSLTPILRPWETITYGKKLGSKAEESGAKVLIFQSWSRKDNPNTQRQLNDTFLKWAASTSARIIPIGDAWHVAIKDYPAIELYDADGSHPSILGSYLSAVVISQMLFHDSTGGSESIYHPSSISTVQQEACWSAAKKAISK